MPSLLGKRKNSAPSEKPKSTKRVRINCCTKDASFTSSYNATNSLCDNFNTKTTLYDNLANEVFAVKRLQKLACKTPELNTTQFNADSLLDSSSTSSGSKHFDDSNEEQSAFEKGEKLAAMFGGEVFNGFSISKGKESIKAKCIN